MILLLLVFAGNVYRAATQACTADEAFTYNAFASKPIEEILTGPYDANNHVLYSILCRATQRVLGVSELSLRLPSLAGGLLFLISAYRLCLLYFGRSRLAFLTFAALACNPFVLDYLSLARGYGLGLGLFFFAMDQISHDSGLTYAGFALGLAVAANLIFLVPASALIAVFFYLNRRASLDALLNRLVLPAVVTATVLLLLPLLHAKAEMFYVGEKSIAASVDSMVRPAFSPRGTWFVPVAEIAMWVVATVILLATIEALRNQRLALALNGGVLILSALILLGAHRFAGVPYPVGRTGIYLPVLFTLAASLLMQRFSRTMVDLLWIPIVALFFLNWNFYQPYYLWQGDAGIARLVRALMKEHKDASVRVASSHIMKEQLRFYRRRYHLGWMELAPEGELQAQADYYVYSARDGNPPGGYEVLFRDGESGLTLTRRR